GVWRVAAASEPPESPGLCRPLRPTLESPGVPRFRGDGVGARMDRWWSDGTETGSRLWQGILAIVAIGATLGMAQNALVRMGSPKDGVAWRYEPPKLD